LLRDIETSRGRGFFVTRGENVAEVMAISIARRVGDEPYGVAVAGPVGRLDANQDALVTALLKAGQALQQLGVALRGQI